MTHPTLIDTHCHLDFHAYDTDRDVVVANATANGITRIINPGTDLITSQGAISMSETYSAVYAGVALHPNSTASWSPEAIVALEHLAAHPKVIAIGEIGLDYYWDKVPKGIQQAAFEAQLELARRLKLPIIIHNRDASEDVIATLKAWIPSLPPDLKANPGVMHSFSASVDIAETALGLGFYLGFTGPVTFKNADELRQVAAAVPLDRILIETDGPYLTPHPYRGQRNEPAHVRLVAERMAMLHQVSEAEFAAISTANAERLFGLAEINHA